jgi:hypothetical protein
LGAQDEECFAEAREREDHRDDDHKSIGTAEPSKLDARKRRIHDA